MYHQWQEVMRRVLAGECGAQESEHAAEHLLSCGQCRTEAANLIDELRVARPGMRSEGPLKLVFDLIDRERQWGAASLAAIAEWVEVRSLAGRRTQRDRVRMSKACHTISFFNLVLAELKETPSWDEAEFLASLALLSIEVMSQRNLIRASTSDLQAEVWTAVANARRKAAEWKRVHQALDQAEKHRKAGSGDPRLEASLLSITASTLADEGQVPQALAALERCRSTYEGLSERSLLARTLVKMANILAGTRDIEHELYKDAFLDLLYLYERHVKAGDLEKAARVCRRALTDPTLSEAAHDQMRDLWTQLLEAAQRQAISQDLLRELRQYCSVHWKHPAAIPPSLTLR